MKNYIIIITLFLFHFKDASAQTVRELTQIAQTKSINSVETILSGYGYSYDGTETMVIEGVIHNLITFKSGNNMVMIYKNKDNWLSVQLLTYDQSKFNSLKHGIENLGGNLVDEKVYGESYTRNFVYENFMYSFDISPSKEFTNKKMFTVTIANLDNYR